MFNIDQALTKNPFAKFEDAADNEVPTAVLQIYNGISEYIERKPDTHVNRASSATLCVRRRWYQKNGRTGKPLTPRKIVNFTLGDLTEKTLQFFIKQGCVGPGKLYSEVDFGEVLGEFTFNGKTISVYKQHDLTATLGDIEVTAHVDGWGKRNLDGEWELIEIKSSADYGFQEFKEYGPGDYLNQAMVNLQTNRAKELGAKYVRFFYLRKSTGHLWDRVFPFDEAVFSQVTKEFALANASEIPDRPYGPIDETFRSKPTGRKVLPWQCQYCPFSEECHGNVKVEWAKGQFGVTKPVYVVSG